MPPLPARSSSCTPAATTRPATTWPRRSGRRSPRSSSSGASFRCLDLAYQGFAAGLEPDGAVVARFAALGIPLLVASSFSKSFSLYGERVGGLSVVAADAAEAARVLSQLKVTIRTTYSSPPTHGAAVVAKVLMDAELRALWVRGARRHAAADPRNADGPRRRARSRRCQQGLRVHRRPGRACSATAASRPNRCTSCARSHGVYGTDAGRICVAALNPGNVDHVARAIADVL